MPAYRYTAASRSAHCLSLRLTHHGSHATTVHVVQPKFGLKNALIWYANRTKSACLVPGHSAEKVVEDRTDFKAALETPAAGLGCLLGA